MIDPGEILKRHLEALTLTEQEREDLAATFHRLVELTGEGVQGADVTADLEQIEAQLALWKSGALSASSAALRDAVREYAEEAGRIVLGIVRTAVRGLI